MLKKSLKVFDLPTSDSSYLSVSQDSENRIKMYYRKWLKHCHVWGIHGNNSKNFTFIEDPLIKKTDASHNFTVTYQPHLKLFIGIGGLEEWKRQKRWHEITDFEIFKKEFEGYFHKPYVRDEARFLSLKKALKGWVNHSNGLYLFHSKDGINWNQRHPNHIATIHDKGFTCALDWGKSSDFDGMNNLVYNPHEQRYYLYVRSNVAKGVRYIQYATSKDLITWSKWKNINMIPEFDKHTDGYYFPNFMMHPTKNIMFGLVPYCSAKKSSIQLFKSTDGYNWNYVEEYLSRPPVPLVKKGKIKTYKNYHHPVLGYLYDKDQQILYFYMQNNYFMYDRSHYTYVDRYKVMEKELDKRLWI